MHSHHLHPHFLLLYYAPHSHTIHLAVRQEVFVAPRRIVAAEERGHYVLEF